MGRGGKIVVANPQDKQKRRATRRATHRLCSRERLVAGERSDRDGFVRANVDASTAIAAGLFVDHGHVFLHRNGFQWASLNAFATSGALFGVNCSCHEIKLRVKGSKVATLHRGTRFSQPIKVPACFIQVRPLSPPYLQNHPPSYPTLGLTETEVVLSSAGPARLPQSKLSKRKGARQSCPKPSRYSLVTVLGS
jgi:hypothetical protein